MQHATATPPPLRKFNPNVPSAVEQVVARSLQKEPEDRFTSALEMQQVLRSCAKELARKQAPIAAQPSQAYPHQYAPSADGQGQFPTNRGQY